MQKYEILKRIEEVGVVGVIREDNPERAITIAQAYKAGGINAVEITFTVPQAQNVIESLVNEFDDSLIVGAGTVLDSTTARIAMLAGAKFIVSPSLDLATAKLCNRYQIPYLPGCMTVGEIIIAMESGCDVIKLISGSAFGADFVEEIKVPLPQVNVMPAGGVSLENASKWIKNGCFAIAMGGSIAQGSCEEIANLATQFVEQVVIGRS